jgi:hypothetical protein
MDSTAPGALRVPAACQVASPLDASEIMPVQRLALGLGQ